MSPVSGVIGLPLPVGVRESVTRDDVGTEEEVNLGTAFWVLGSLHARAGSQFGEWKRIPSGSLDNGNSADLRRSAAILAKINSVNNRSSEAGCPDRRFQLADVVETRAGLPGACRGVCSSAGTRGCALFLGTGAAFRPRRGSLGRWQGHLWNVAFVWVV